MSAIDELTRIRARRKVFGECLRGDPAWEILIDLAVSGKERIGSVGMLTGVPATTVLRYVGSLENDGLIEREADPHDRRLTIIGLTERGREAVERCLADTSSAAVSEAA